ncbi:MAG: hypothetical protein LBV32_06460 [Tannerellaceae bacterium]|jgi:hypothetical protein|nr:hypothetical protein [Tannerellaceae bacterium]
MNTNEEKDYLKELFGRLQEEPLPENFRMQIMQQIREEAVWIKKRNECLSWITLILASLAILTTGILAVIYLGIPKFSFEISMEAIQTLPFYLYIVFPVSALLFADFYFRKKYKEKHNE